MGKIVSGSTQYDIGTSWVNGQTLKVSGTEIVTYDPGSVYAASSTGVTNGDSHDHSGGDGAQINHTTLSNIGTNTHAQIDIFIGTKAQASGLASLDGSSLVVQNPANATSTATASKIPIADGSGKLDTWVSDCASGTKGKIQLTGQLGGSAASPTVTGITETGSSQALTFGTIADGGYVKRSGTALATADLYTDIIFTIDGGGAEIADNATIWRQVNFAGTIISWTLLADASGSITIDIWKDTYANFPPTDADSITASAVPAISSATSATSSTLTGWTTSISAGDILKINVDSCTTIKTCVLQLKVKL